MSKAAKREERPSRREVLAAGTGAAGLLACGVQAWSAGGGERALTPRVRAHASGTEEEAAMADQAVQVQVELMRPGELEAALRKFPAAYVPFGTIEWHGRHLPLGCDFLKAHGILVRCARLHGGVVMPPVYFHSGFPQDHLVPTLTALFQGVKRMGARVIMGVSGHNVREQIDMIDKAMAPVLADGTVKGLGLWEVTLSMGPESGTDHAAKWETSDMMALHPDCVNLGALGTGPLAPDMKPPDGIGGLDPRKHATRQVGERNIELAANAIGRKARELLESLPEEHRGLRPKAISPEYWWMV